MRAVLLGILGLVVLAGTVTPPEGVPWVLVLVNSAQLLLLAAAGGAWAAPRLALHSAAFLGNDLATRPAVIFAAAGAAAGCAIALVDHQLAAFWRSGNGYIEPADMLGCR